jgi:signal peptidase I
MKRLVEWSLFAMVVLGIWIIAGPSSLGGPASYVIVEGSSMGPTYHDGDLVIAYQRDTYAIGDSIVYDAPVSAQFNVIHRIVERTEGGFITQGDNMDRPDGWIAPHDEIHGAALFHLPKGGVLVRFLRTPAALAALLAGWVFFEIAKREEKQKAADPAPRRERIHDQGRRRGAMNKPVHVLLVMLSVLLLSAFTVSAASLNVDAGTLQTFHFDVDIPTD